MKHIIKNILKMVGVSIVIVLFTLVGLWIDIRYIEPNLLVEKNIKLDKNIKLETNTLQNGKEELSIVQFTDTHLGPDYSIKELKQLVKKINSGNPDLIVFTGDLMDHPGQYPYRDEIGEVLSGLESKYGKFAVWGNHDHGGAGIRYYEDIMESGGFVLLQNEHVEVVTEAGKKINIIGLDDALLGEVNVQKAFKHVAEADYTLLLMHEPDLVQDIKTDTFDLSLAGHSHGGQIQLPFIGPLYTPGLAKVYTHGLYELDDEKYLYVNSGVGTTQLEIRFFNPPQIAWFHIAI